MVVKNFRIRPEGSNDFADVLHPETNADMVKDTANKVIMTMAERNKLSNLYNYVHPSGTNPHGTTKADIGLSLVDNVKQMPITGGTYTGIAVAQTNTSYSTRQLRNVIISTSNPSGGGSGDVWIKYEG